MTWSGQPNELIVEVGLPLKSLQAQERAQIVQNPEVWVLLGRSGQLTLMVVDTEPLWREDSSPEIKHSLLPL